MNFRCVRASLPALFCLWIAACALGWLDARRRNGIRAQARLGLARMGASGGEPRSSSHHRRPSDQKSSKRLDLADDA
jgi:hypothetical protein